MEETKKAPKRIDIQLAYKFSDNLKLRIKRDGQNHLEIIYDQGPSRSIGFLSEKAKLRELLDALQGKKFFPNYADFHFSDSFMLRMYFDYMDLEMNPLDVFEIFYKSSSKGTLKDKKEMIKFTQALDFIL